jgi:hypothetical protein
VIVRATLERLATLDAQARAVFPTQRRDRLCQDYRVADLTFELDLVVIVQPEDVGFGFRVYRKATGRIDGRQRLLLDLDLDWPVQLAEAAAAALLDRRGEPAADQQAAIGPGEPDFARYPPRL